MCEFSLKNSSLPEIKSITYSILVVTPFLPGGGWVGTKERPGVRGKRVRNRSTETQGVRVVRRWTASFTEGPSPSTPSQPCKCYVFSYPQVETSNLSSLPPPSLSFRPFPDPSFYNFFSLFFPLTSRAGTRDEVFPDPRSVLFERLQTRYSDLGSSRPSDPLAWKTLDVRRSYSNESLVTPTRGPFPCLPRRGRTRSLSDTNPTGRPLCGLRYRSRTRPERRLSPLRQRVRTPDQYLQVSPVDLGFVSHSPLTVRFFFFFFSFGWFICMFFSD